MSLQGTLTLRLEGRFLISLKMLTDRFGTTVVMVTHNLELAGMTDRSILYQGWKNREGNIA